MLTYCFNLIILIITGVLSTINQYTSIEYLYNQKMYNNSMLICLLISISLFYVISAIFVLIMILTFTSSDYEELRELDDTEYELTLAIRLLNKHGYWTIIFIFPLFLFLTLTKFIGFFHLKTILEKRNQIHFLCITSHTLFISYITQIVFLTIPTLFLQIINNLLLNEDVHNKHARGVINLSSICGLLLITIQGILFFVAESDRFNFWNNKLTVQVSKSLIENKEMKVSVTV